MDLAKLILGENRRIRDHVKHYKTSEEIEAYTQGYKDALKYSETLAQYRRQEDETRRKENKLKAGE